MIERGVSLDAMKNVAAYPQNRRLEYDGEHGGKVYRMSKHFGARQLTVIAEMKGSECWMISCFYE